MSRILSIFFIFIASASASASELKSESEILPFVESVMAKFGAADYQGGIHILKPYLIASTEQIDAVTLQTELARKQAVNALGKPFGFEFLGVKHVGTSLIRVVYLEKTEKSPVTWTFIFYRNAEGWVIPAFKFEPPADVPFIHDHD